MSEAKFDIGMLVNLNAIAYSSLPEENQEQVAETYADTIFRVKERAEVDGEFKYRLPGYDWQGNEWVNESLLEQWTGEGPITISVTIDPEGESRKAMWTLSEKLKKQIYEVAQNFASVEVEFTEEPAPDLDKVAES